MTALLAPGVELPRHVAGRLKAALGDTRVVAVVGPRQSGKTTLVRNLAGPSRRYLTLDDAAVRAFARSDPTGFIRGIEQGIIDEVQRAPDLLLAIKKRVDEQPGAGRFIVTGSADLLSSIASDSLAGRMEIVRLDPLSRAELALRPPSRFVASAFEGKLARAVEPLAAGDLIERVTAGGFPEALRRSNHERRADWLKAYARALAERDIPELAVIDKRQALPRLLNMAAAVSGGLLNHSALAARLHVDAKTVDRWLALMERVFLIERVPAWSRNRLKRLGKTPRMHFTDSGVVAALRDVSPARVRRDRAQLGPLLESFVFAELLHARAAAKQSFEILHYRDKDQYEVDFVLEDNSGRVTGVEVKASATVVPKDARGLMRLAQAAGDDFALGVLLYDGNEVIAIGDKLWAAPLAVLLG